MNAAGMWVTLGVCLGMVLAAHAMPRHHAWLDRRQAARDAAAAKLEVRR